MKSMFKNFGFLQLSNPTVMQSDGHPCTKRWVVSCMLDTGDQNNLGSKIGKNDKNLKILKSGTVLDHFEP